MKEQRRARRIAMSAAERDAFLQEERTCRVATLSPDGPHVTPLSYVWHQETLWLYSITRSQRWTDLQRDPRVAVVVDAGPSYFELRGVEMVGRVEMIGEQPRTGEQVPELEVPERMFAQRYGSALTAEGRMALDGRHAWVRLRPTKIVSWDFRKLAALRAEAE